MKAEEQSNKWTGVKVLQGLRLYVHISLLTVKTKRMGPVMGSVNVFSHSRLKIGFTDMCACVVLYRDDKI